MRRNADTKGAPSSLEGHGSRHVFVHTVIYPPARSRSRDEPGARSSGLNTGLSMKNTPASRPDGRPGNLNLRLVKENPVGGFGRLLGRLIISVLSVGRRPHQGELYPVQYFHFTISFTDTFIPPQANNGSIRRSRKWKYPTDGAYCRVPS